MKKLLSFGHGYSARALARQLSDDWDIVGTTRSAAKVAGAGVPMRVWPGADLSDDIKSATHLLISSGPGEGGDPVLRDYADLIAEQAGRLTWVGYLSTTGVYGDHAGGWVDETSPLTPSTKRGKMRLQTERAWQAIEGLPLHIFRLAGIYGPGRGPFAKVRNGTARRIIKEGQVFSRIHVEDIAQVLAASIAHPNPGAVYNVCDHDPAPPQDVIAHAAELLGRDVPPDVPFEEAEMTPMARSFYAESKRVSNSRMREELGVELTYPGYRDGLAAMLAEDDGTLPQRDH
ncbi:SDR family oxidoreductase [Pseudaestuariivita sp.]|uniref:SDR family oxidoreductase n=1 Tax=Pseudaestuariivita sp. TaxID=2211669 RepID=UPI0040588142